MYSRHSGGFLASSRFRLIRFEDVLQLPHLVFIFCTKTCPALTPRRVSHVASNGGRAARICSRYQWATTSWRWIPTYPIFADNEKGRQLHGLWDSGMRTLIREGTLARIYRENRLYDDYLDFIREQEARVRREASSQD